MLFNSFSFLAFFAVVAIVYYVMPPRRRWAWLLAASGLFYAALEPAYLVLLLGITSVAYGSGLALETAAGKRRTALLTAGVGLPMLMLFAFKYYDFVARSVDALAAGGGTYRLPRLEIVVAAGLSFYTFSCVSYLADVHAGTLRAERHFGRFALYVAFFPKLLAGPIERAKPFLAQLARPIVFDGSRTAVGLQLILWGLVKKMVIADRLAPLVDAAYRQPAFASPADLVLATYLFAFQLYCDFSGYSDIAIGAAKVLGFDLMENFRRPYLSASVREFWNQRWHLSLSSWFRDYLYIPLGGNRRSRLRVLVNIMIVFLTSGLWHGANWTFIAWGGLNGLYLAVAVTTVGARDRLSTRLRVPIAARRVVGTIVTFHLVLVSWVFFRASSLADARMVFSRIAGSITNLPALLQIRLTQADVVGPLALIGMLLLVEMMDERRPLLDRLGSRPTAVRWAVYYAQLIGLIVLGRWGQQQFVYMQF